MKLLTAVVLSLMTATAYADDLLKLTTGTGSLDKVPLASGAIATVSGKSIEVKTVGTGIRQKEIVFTLDAYVAQMMVSDPSRYVKTDAGALASIDNQQAVVMQLTFLINAPNRELTQSISESLASNNIPANDPDAVQMMKAVQSVGAVTKGNSMSIVMMRNADGSNTVAFENSATGKPTQFTGTSQLIHKIMACWLGVPSDDLVASLKAQLLQ